MPSSLTLSRSNLYPSPRFYARRTRGDSFHMRTLSIASLLGILLLSNNLIPHTQEANAAPPPLAPAEFMPSQSATKPEPFPIKHVDQGQFDPRLKGILLPEGFKAEIVIGEPDTINPVGMTFDPDGNLYVMEWRPDAVT